MPKSVNKVILVGNVGKDPEVRYSQSGTPIAVVLKSYLASASSARTRNT